MPYTPGLGAGVPLTRIRDRTHLTGTAVQGSDPAPDGVAGILTGGYRC